MVLNVLGEELRWADGVNCETSNGILQPKVGHVGFGGGYVKKVAGGTSFIEFLGWFFRSFDGDEAERPLIWLVKLKCFAS